MRHLRRAFRLVVPGLALLWTACGSAANTARTPSPSPYTEPTTLAFVHLLTEGQLGTYTVSPVTGLLARTDVEDVPGGKVFLAADPKGRFVFVNFLPTGQKRPLLRSYRVLADTGSLEPADQQYSYEAVDLAATDEVVFVSYPSQGDPHHPHCDVAAFVPHEDGFLEAKPLHADPGVHVSAFGGRMAAVGSGRRLYRTGSDDRTVQSLYVHPGRWAVYLDSEAWGWVADEEPAIARPLVAGDVLVTASSTGLLKTFMPDWGEARLQGQPPVQGAGPLLAYTGGVLAAASTDGRVEIYTVGESGGLTLKKSTTLPALRSLAFHPTGRFLYVSGTTLRTYLVETDGTLRPYAETEAAAGLLAVTTPPAP